MIFIQYLLPSLFTSGGGLLCFTLSPPSESIPLPIASAAPVIVFPRPGMNEFAIPPTTGFKKLNAFEKNCFVLPHQFNGASGLELGSA